MGETAEQRRLRMAVARLVDRGIARITEMLRLRLLLPEERAVGDEIGIGPRYRETWTAHIWSLEAVLTIMLGLRRRLEEGPVPDVWHGDESSGGTLVLQFRDPDERELERYVYHYADSLSDRRFRELVVVEHIPVIAPHWTDRASMTGIQVFAPDPMCPESVLRLEPTVMPRGPVMELWRDEARRLFYLWQGRRQYIFDAEGQFPAR